MNSSPPSVAFLRQGSRSALVQVMACRPFGAKPLPEPMLAYSQLNPGNKFQYKSNRNSIIFIPENAFEIVVCPKVAAILSRGDELTNCVYISWGILNVPVSEVCMPLSRWHNCYNKKRGQFPWASFTDMVCLRLWPGGKGYVSNYIPQFSICGM